MLFRSHRAAAEAMALLVPGEAPTDGVAADVDLLAGLKGGDGNGATQFKSVDAGDAVFAQMAQRLPTRSGQVAAGGLVDELFADVSETELDGGVAVGAGGFELGDAAGASLDHGDRDGPALFIEELGHAQLLPEDADGHRKENSAS